MNEKLGIFEERQETAAKYARFVDPPRLEPADPRADGEVEAFLTDVAGILAERVFEERMRLAAMPIPATVEAQNFQAPPITKERTPVVGGSIPQVQSVFLEILYESGYRLKGGRRFKQEHLASSIRSREVSWPRQVCMSLVRDICPGPPSTPSIGKAFGNKDHTTVMHAIGRTPDLLIEWRQLADIHAKVLAAFGVKK